MPPKIYKKLSSYGINTHKIELKYKVQGRSKCNFSQWRKVTSRVEQSSRNSRFNRFDKKKKE